MPEERKLVTILFADVTGSTALGEALDPEDVRALMGRYYQHARRVIGEHGGTLEKFIGDAVMAIFGLPQAHGNDPERALAAALALRAALEGDPLLAGRLLLRMGVNTGEVVATRDASAGDFLVTGDAVNVAARLQQAATPGEILAGERTQAAGAVAFHFAEARAIEVKGKRQPLSVFPLVGPRPARALSRPPLVGRRRELAQLGLLRDAALEERHPQLVSIVAPAGTGKTRLLEEFLAGLDPATGWQVATARCPPYGQSLTYWPLRGLLDELLSTQLSLERVAEAFATGGHSAEDAERLAGLVLATLGIEMAEQTERESIFNAWRLLIEALARQAPRIVVFEDLHWAGESLLDLVEHVMHPRTRAPLLIVVLSRPELLDRRPSWGGGRRSFTSLALGPLSEAQTRQLVDQLVPGLASEAVRERVVERSGGNPFFAIELSRGLAERTAELANAASAGADALPDTVHEAVLARLDLLSEPEREVLQVAAVAGRTFRLPTLRAALPERDPSAIAAALEGLLARDVVTPAEGEEDAYSFHHILFRDVAYGTLARAERVRMHAAVAGWLEGFAAGRLDEFAELLAFHYWEAVTASLRSTIPLPLPFETVKAVSCLERAGELASRSGAVGDASRHLRNAITIAPVLEHIRLYEKLGDCAPGGTTALAAYQEALQRWRDAGRGDPLAGARLLRKVLILYGRWLPFTTSRPPDGVLAQLGAEARQLADKAGDEDETWRVRVAEIFWLAWHGQATIQEAAAGRQTAVAAAAYFEQRGDWPSFSEALEAYTRLPHLAGKYREVAEAARRRLAAPSLPLWERGDALSRLLGAHFALGEYERGLSLMREALSQVRPGDPLTGCARALAAASFAAWVHGRWSDLDDFVAAVEEARQQQPDDHDAAFLMAAYWVALSAAVARADQAAADRIASFLTRIYPMDEEENEGILFSRNFLAALIEDDPGRLDLALLQRVLLQHRLNLAGGAGVHTLMFLSEHGISVGQGYLDGLAEQAQGGHQPTLLRCIEIARALVAADPACLEESIDAAEAQDLIPHAARMRVVLAERTGDASQLERARPVLERLGDRQFLRRLEEVQAALR